MAPRPPRGVPKGASEFIKNPGSARVRRRDQFSWEPLQEGDVLYEGDQVRTPRGSSPIVRSGGKETPLVPDSLRQVGPRGGKKGKK